MCDFLYSKGTYAQIVIPGLTSTYLSGINDQGQLAGHFFTRIDSHGFVDTNGAVTTIDVPGKADTGVTGINDAGQIVGTYGAFQEAFFLASPVPEPGVWALFSFGALSSALVALKKKRPTCVGDLSISTNGRFQGIWLGGLGGARRG